MQRILNLLFCGLAVLQDKSHELQRHSGQRVIGINGHGILVDLHHASHESLVVLVHEGDDGSRENIFVVEMSVDGKRLTLHLVHALWLIVAKSLGRKQGEIKLLARLQLYEALLEGVEREAKATDKRER